MLKVSAISKSFLSILQFSIRDKFSKLFGNFLLFSKTIYYLLCLLRSDWNSMPFWFSLINYHIYFFVFCMLFLSLSDLLLRNFFLSFHLTITPRWISLFMKVAWYVRMNMLFNRAIVFATDRQVSLKCFKPLSFICKYDFLSLFNTWSPERVLLKNL